MFNFCFTSKGLFSAQPTFFMFYITNFDFKRTFEIEISLKIKLLYCVVSIIDVANCLHILNVGYRFEINFCLKIDKILCV